MDEHIDRHVNVIRHHLHQDTASGMFSASCACMKSYMDESLLDTPAASDKSTPNSPAKIAASVSSTQDESWNHVIIGIVNILIQQRNCLHAKQIKYNSLWKEEQNYKNIAFGKARELSTFIVDILHYRLLKTIYGPKKAFSKMALIQKMEIKPNTLSSINDIFAVHRHNLERLIADYPDIKQEINAYNAYLEPPVATKAPDGDLSASIGRKPSTAEDNALVGGADSSSKKRYHSEIGSSDNQEDTCRKRIP